MRLHGRPFAGNDAVDAGVTEGSVFCQLMVAQHTVELRSQSLDPTAALVIEKMRPKLDRDAAQRLEGMLKKEKFALGIDGGALNAVAVPGSADHHKARHWFGV